MCSNDSHKFESLFNLCLKYLVYNVDRVESLEGIPEIVGEELFNRCLACFQIDGIQSVKLEKWNSVMTVFVDAYKQEILKSLNFCKNGWFLNHYLEFLSPFIYIRELDFSFCRIGNYSDVLLYIGQLNFLQNLFLNDNGIKLDGIKTLTMHQRRKRNGLNKLETISLVNNDICYSSLPYLQLLPRLHAVIIDSRTFRKWTVNKKNFNSRFKHCCIKNPPCHFDAKGTKVCVSNDGWIAPFLTNQMFPKSKNQQDINKKRVFSSFYGSRKKYTSSACYSQCSNDIMCDEIVIFCDHTSHHLFVDGIISRTQTLTQGSSESNYFKMQKTISKEELKSKVDYELLHIYS